VLVHLQFARSLPPTSILALRDGGTHSCRRSDHRSQVHKGTRKLAQQRITLRASCTRLSQQKSSEVFLEVFSPRPSLMLTLEWLGEVGYIWFSSEDQASKLLFLLHAPLQLRKYTLYRIFSSPHLPEIISKLFCSLLCIHRNLGNLQLVSSIQKMKRETLVTGFLGLRVFSIGTSLDIPKEASRHYTTSILA
jgi:hypothetical protein